MHTIAIRHAVDTDVEPLRRFLTGLAMDTAHRRFFTGLGTVSPRTLAALLRRDDRQEVLLAWCGPDIVGHAMVTAMAGRPGVAEFAVVVADAWQGHGLGPLLGERLLAAARVRGVRDIAMATLADNDVAIGLIRQRWPQARPVRGQALCEYLVPLPEVPAALGALGQSRIAHHVTVVV